MTRVTIIYEGIDQGYGYIVEVGATEWEEGKEYPIVENFNFTDVKWVLGKATDVRREENNEITAEVPDELIIRDPKDEKTPWVFFPAYTTGVVTDPPKYDPKKHDPRNVKKCFLKAVGRCPIQNVTNPGAVIKS